MKNKEKSKIKEKKVADQPGIKLRKIYSNDKPKG